MPKKRATQEEKAARAKARGYVEGAHEEEDNNMTEDQYTDESIKLHERALSSYKDWMGTKDENCLGKGQHTPSLVKIKDFIRFYIISSDGVLSDRPVVSSVLNFAERFFAGFTRVTGSKFDKEITSHVYHWIKYTLPKHRMIENKKRKKLLFTHDDLTNILVTLWTEDDPLFIHERNRIQLTFALLVYCYSGARIGAFVPDLSKAETRGLCYKDIELRLFRTEDGHLKLIYQLDQRWVKNNRDPENTRFGVAMTEYDKLRFDPIPYLLALAFADDALFGLNSPAALWTRQQQTQIPKGQSIHLLWNESVLEQPILRNVTMTNGASDTKAMNRETFCRLFRAMVRNAGYYENITIHTLRRGLANKVNKVATESERSQILTHKDPNLFGNEYIAHLSSVDAQAIFVDGVPNTEHIKHLQSVGKYRQIGLPCHLPAERKAALLQDPDLLDLKRQLQQLMEKNSDECVISTAKKRLLVHQSCLEPEALKKYRQEWIRTRLEREVLSFATGPPDDFVNTDFVEDLYLLMPERRRLAMTIDSEQRLSSEEKLQSIQDLLALCVRNFDVIYRPGEQPAHGACPVSGCGLSLDRIARSRRSSHIHSCRRREFAVVHGHQECELHYCFQCFQWYHEKNQWEAHCREHLSSTIIRRCEVSTYCHTLIRPAYCPICLGNENIPAASRMKSWTRSSDLWKHLNHHLETIQSRWPASCPHPRCDCQVIDEQSFRYHLSDVHGLRQRWSTQKSEPKQNEATPAPIPEEVFDHTSVSRTRKRKRREKPSSESPASDSELPKPRRSRRIALMLNKKSMSSASRPSSVDQSHNPGPRPSLATGTESGFSETVPYYLDNSTALSHTPTPTMVSSISESCSTVESDIRSFPGSPSMVESPLTDISMNSIPIDPCLLLEFKK